MAERSASYSVGIRRGLLDPKHYANMGMAIWLFLYLVDRQTSPEGEVAGGHGIRDEDIARKLGVGLRTVQRWRATLLAYPYITSKVAQDGVVYTIASPKKWGVAICGDPDPTGVATSGDTSEGVSPHMATRCRHICPEVSPYVATPYKEEYQEKQKSLRETQNTNTFIEPLELTPDPPPGVSVEERIYRHWLTACGKPTRTALTEKRRKAIRARLKEFSEADLIRAVNACAASEWHRGDNPNGVVYTDLADHILRSREKVEGWLERSERKPNGKANGARNGGPKPIERLPPEEAARETREAIEAYRKKTNKWKANV